MEVHQTLRATMVEAPFAHALDAAPSSTALEIERNLLFSRHKVLKVLFSTHTVGRFSHSIVLR